MRYFDDRGGAGQRNRCNASWQQGKVKPFALCRLIIDIVSGMEFWGEANNNKNNSVQSVVPIHLYRAVNLSEPD